jgi:ferrochelatase
MSEIIKNRKKIAVVLFNLGGPDSLSAVKPFLFNLFNDKYIITLPSALRFFIAKLISNRREKFAQEIYSKTGDKSLILKETISQREALKKELVKSKDSEFEVFICMRHWHPMAKEIMKSIKNYDPEEIIMLPLYPQFSTTTTASSIEEFIKNFNKEFTDKIKLKTICCYPIDKGFIDSHVRLIEGKLQNNPDMSNFRMLFSAHGLPEKIIKAGDPYQWQIEQTVLNIIDKLKLNSKFKNIDYKITYQSKVGSLKWLDPNTEDEIKIAGTENKSLIIIPVAFISEHVETLVELDIEYKKMADIYKINYIRIPTLSTNELFIKSLVNMILNFSKKSFDCLFSSNFDRICPASYSKCPCKEK